MLFLIIQLMNLDNVYSCLTTIKVKFLPTPNFLECLFVASAIYPWNSDLLSTTKDCFDFLIFHK